MSNQADRNLALIDDLYDAYRRADLLWLQRHTAPDVVLEVAGSSRISGLYRGMGASLAFGASAEFQFVPGTLVVEEITGDDDHVRTVTRINVRGLGLAEREMRILQEYRFDDEGRISRVAFAAEDQDGFDEWIGRGRPVRKSPPPPRT